MAAVWACLCAYLSGVSGIHSILIHGTADFIAESCFYIGRVSQYLRKYGKI